MKNSHRCLLLYNQNQREGVCGLLAEVSSPQTPSLSIAVTGGSSDTPWNLSENLSSSLGLRRQGKSTSPEARCLLKAEQDVGQAEKGQIAPGELVPTNKEPPVAVEPDMQPFHHPAPRTLARLPLGGLGELIGSGPMAVIAVPPIGAHMRDVVACLHFAQRR